MALDAYLQQTERFLREQGQHLLNPEDLISYCNRARREIVLRTQSIRVLPPISGQVQTIELTARGSNYSPNPTVTISAPDFPGGDRINPNGAQATAVAIVIGGIIDNISVTFGGAGYFQPVVTITDSQGTGAKATATTSPLMLLNIGQEIYRFADIPLGNFPGVKSVFAARSKSIIFNNYRYSLSFYPFTIYQAMVRNYASQYKYIPTIYSMLGQGTSGSLYFYPLPSQIYQCEIDCLCLPSDLTSDEDFEAIPEPWTDAVPYLCASLCYSELQNFNASKYYLDMYDNFVKRYSQYTRISTANSVYGRY